MTHNTTDVEIGSCLADLHHILKFSVQPRTHKRSASGLPVSNAFPGSEAVDVLTDLGLVRDRATAVARCTQLVAGRFLVELLTESTEFQDGLQLYRFAKQSEMTESLQELKQKSLRPVAGASRDTQLMIALEVALDIPMEDRTSSHQLRLPSGNHLSPEEEKGIQLAQLAERVEPLFEIDDRKHLLRTYEQCFVGKDAVDKLLYESICSSREDAVELMQSLSNVGLIAHVLHAHGFEDKQYFYRFTSTEELRYLLDEFSQLPKAPKGSTLTRQAAAVSRYQQQRRIPTTINIVNFGQTGARKLNVPDILNSFYACDTPEGWDQVDLAHWRTHMKRWGFGRREDIDRAMVEKISDLVLDVDDPESWYECLSSEEKYEMTSPWGVLAQIAMFDQIPRAAFRGTTDAFKWDGLAIKASQLAIAQGYFDTAYKSTLNKLLVLLPLQHSEDWEHQKLAVNMMMTLLSEVAVEDEGLSEYEIVKRLEFSKRLTTAVLEHAQVIAKFKHFPHRNKALGRSPSLEERIWLASDLVPRWARSQNSELAHRDVLELPLIPLKQLSQEEPSKMAQLDEEVNI